MKKITLISLILAFAWQTKAQQEAQFTHYMFNTLAVNSGYAGSREALTVTGLHRSQWVDFPGAPVTQTLTLHSPVFNENIGLGLSLVNDKLGANNNTSIYADFAYRIKAGRGKLAFGLKAGVNMKNTDLAALELGDQNDQAFGQAQKEVLPNVGFGLYYYTDRFYLGASTPKLLENEYSSNTVSGSSEVSKDTRHYFLIAGTVINITKNEHVKLKPTTFIKITNGAPLDLDFTATFLFRDKFWIGPMARLGDGYGVLLGYNFTDQLSAGYSFDWSTTNTTIDYNHGSHELMLKYDFFFRDQDKIRSPRYF